MTRQTLPRIFRIAAALTVAAIVLGGWWQHQPVGATGRDFLDAVKRACPAAVPVEGHWTVADTAHALDRLAHARLAGLVRAGDRCVAGVTQ